MNRSPLARLCAVAALGFAVLASFNAAMLGNAWLDLALRHAALMQDSWPTFSRALSVGNPALNGLLAGIGGAGLFAGSLSLSVMQWQRARQWPRARGVLTVMCLMAACSALLGVVHYFHVAITLEVNNRLHMLFSYTFFFGMSGMIVADLFCHLWLARLPAHEAPARIAGAHRAIGIGVLAVGAVFLLTYVLKDVEANPWSVETQRLFVVAEFAWVVLAHAYGLCYMPVLRRHFRVQIESYAGADPVRMRT